ARHNYQAKTQLAFNNLVNGQTRSRAGTEYNITIAAKDGNDADMLKNYIAIVIDGQFRTLCILFPLLGEKKVDL
ncbi:cysteine proteinase inhibitor 4-like protein, partial [Tanacetum coccineum]